MKRYHVLILLCAAPALFGCHKPQQAAAPNDAVVTHATLSPGGNWGDVVNDTAAGGIMMGDPNAKVKLIEIASLGCPYCRAFAQSGVAPLVNDYVKTGKASWEFRPYIIHGSVDLAANLIARCNGSKSFFPLAEALYKDQPQWIGKVEAAPAAKIEAIQNLPPSQAFVAMAQLAGLQEWAAMRGVPHAKSTACLSDQRKIAAEVQMVTDVGNQFPNFTGTPAFVINEELQDKSVTSWNKLKPLLDAALR